MTTISRLMYRDASLCTMQQLDSLEYLPVWLDPENLAETAVYVMDGHGLSVLAAASGDRVVGWVDRGMAASAAKGVKLADICQPFKTILDGDMGIRQAAGVLVREDISVAPVVSNGRFLGLLTSNMLLKELARSLDPLTGLSWADRLREWGASHLRNGVEICLIAFDIVGLTQVNLAKGHREGDLALQNLAHFIAENIDNQTDTAVRYGGGKFLIGTTRSRVEAVEIQRSLALNASQATSLGLTEPVQVRLGLAGGRRTHERVSIHPEANIDDLITLAIHAASSDSHAAVENSDPADGSFGDFELGEIVPSTDPSYRFAASISCSGQTWAGHGGTPGQPASRAALDSVLDALGKALPDAAFSIDEAGVFEGLSGQFEASIAGTLTRGKFRYRLSGSAASELSSRALSLALLESVSSLRLPLP